jgi:ribosome biogenesis GTPase A
LEFADRTELLTLARTIDSHIAHLAHSFETGQALKQGIPVAIVGKTNVGKSTLLNHLLKMTEPSSPTYTEPPATPSKTPSTFRALPSVLLTQQASAKPLTK